MESHLELSDTQFLNQMENCTLHPVLFSHEAHLRLAWLNIHHLGMEEAIAKTCSQLVRYVDSLGASDKYNKTLTVAATRTVHHFMLKSETTNFQDFILEFPRLKTSFKDLIFAHYSFNIFESEQAKAGYMEPDLLPYDSY